MADKILLEDLRPAEGSTGKMFRIKIIIGDG